MDLKGHLATSQDTFSLGTFLGQVIPPPRILVLTGDLGAGKTQLAQGIAVGLNIQEPIVSPTFSLVNSYESFQANLYHLDLYRLLNPLEIFELGLDSYLDDPHGMIVIEWGERILQALSESVIQIKLEHTVTGRRVTILLCPKDAGLYHQLETYFLTNGHREAI